MQKLNLAQFGFSLGVLWGIIVFAFGIYSMITKKGKEIIEMARVIYFGFESSIRGSFIGFFWGFLDGYISGIIIGYIFNLFVR